MFICQTIRWFNRKQQHLKTLQELLGTSFQVQLLLHFILVHQAVMILFLPPDARGPKTAPATSTAYYRPLIGHKGQQWALWPSLRGHLVPCSLMVYGVFFFSRPVCKSIVLYDLWLYMTSNCLLAMLTVFIKSFKGSHTHCLQNHWSLHRPLRSQ